MRSSRILLLCLMVLPYLARGAQPPGEAAAWAANATNQYAALLTDVVYSRADGEDLLLDLFLPASTSDSDAGLVPTVLYFHGGGWSLGSRYTDTLILLPWLERGWAVVNVEYRKTGTSLAPAAVEDARCALRWVGQHAGQHRLDPDRIVLSGISAGGHLALMAAFVSESDGFDYRCPGGDVPKPAAVVNWFGITDLGDLLNGGNRRAFAVAWIGNPADREALARQVSPLKYVRPGLPAVISIHGDADPVVPYDQATDLHRALTRAGSRNELFTVPEGGHGGFPRELQVEAHERIWRFLDAVLPAGGSTVWD